MHIQLSTWEISNISNLINSIYETYGCNLEKSSCLTIGWISYFENVNIQCECFFAFFHFWHYAHIIIVYFMQIV